MPGLVLRTTNDEDGGWLDNLEMLMSLWDSLLVHVWLFAGGPQ
jgi:hypothetical protein